jgi:tetrapyrrole methylase family protein/MazG family protein
VVLRTKIHPTVKALTDAGVSFTSYHGFYEQVDSFEELYLAIARDLLSRARLEGELLYAVPGSPLVAERTVVLLRDLAPGSGVELEILPGMSFVEVLYTRLGLDPIEGLSIMDAEDVGRLKGRPWQSLVVTQVYQRPLASEVKLVLMELYGDEYEVAYVHNLALPDESVRWLPLFELDRQPDIDHLTTVFVPSDPNFFH